VVNVTCPAGQRLNSEATSMLTICNDHGMWDPAVPDCEGTSTAQTSLEIALFSNVQFRPLLSTV